ncbi:hypothetical protein WSM22_32710 [Cytophagales bacterium WSM2-2]|nr:hypothetical protein WSM22_32710 [Cytophagales bacterium WSM2-2]
MCFYEYTSDNEQNKIHAQEALRISQKLNYLNGIGYAQKYLALYYWIKTEYEPATRHGFEMLKAFEQTTNYRGLGQSYAVLGSISQDSHDFDKAKTYYEKAIDIHKKANLKMDVAYDYNSLATLYQSNLQFDQSLKYHLMSKAVREEINDVNGLSQTYGNIALIYKAKKDYTQAKEYFQKALNILEKLHNKLRLAANYANIGSLYTLTGEYDKAAKYLADALVISKALHHKLLLVEVYDNLTKLEAAKGNYKEALQHMQTKLLYNDSIYKENNANKISEIEARYQTEKKDLIISDLQRQKDLQNLKEWFMTAVLLVLIIGFSIVYMLQQSHNRKVKDLLEVQKSLNQKLQEADQIKSRFFANISHEFRTPLSLILAPIEEKLESDKLALADKESFQMIKRNGNHLLSLINQLLDLSKLEAGKMELQVKKGNLGHFLNAVSYSFDSLAENKQITFLKSISADFYESWYDSDKLEKIINNLLSNAFKFTPPQGTVALSISRSDFNNQMEIRIVDTGRGIPQEDLEKVFTPFYQSRFASNENQPGTGLGLSLVQELVKLYGGTIRLESKIEAGTTVYVMLPVEKEQFSSDNFSTAPAQEEIYSSFSASEGYLVTDDEDENFDTDAESLQEAILIVEDNRDLRNFISAKLKDQYFTITARDGNEGFALAIERIPSLIISDVMMPNMDGITLAEKIKNDERTSHIPVVLLTAKADLDSRLEGFQTGVDDYLSKPFSTEELRVRVANLIAQRKKLAAKYQVGLAAIPKADHEPSLDEKFLIKAKKIVEQHMGNSSFGVEQMADEIHLSRAQMFRKLKAISGLSPNEFINDIRLQKAADLIRAKADTLAQISYSVGYNEQSYFAKRFRKKFGVTPSEYNSKAAPKAERQQAKV